MSAADCCRGCGRRVFAQAWILHDYGGVSGRFCNVCYKTVALDAFGKPRHPVKRARFVAALKEAS